MLETKYNTITTVIIIIIVLFVIILLLSEIKILKCFPYPGGCDPHINAQAFKDENRSFACIQAEARVWTRSFLVGFILALVILLVNKIYSGKTGSLWYFITAWLLFAAILFFYFNFYKAHWHRVACKAGL